MKWPLSLLSCLLAIQCLAQSQTATVTAYCRSLCLNSTLAYNGAYTFAFTTEDNSTGLPQYIPPVSGSLPVFSNEVRPATGPNGTYEADYEMLTGNYAMQYGTLLLSIPNLDTNRDGVADVLEPNVPMYSVIPGTGHSSWPSSNYFTMSLRFNRAAGSTAGTFSGNWNIGGGSYNVNGALDLMLLRGSATYTRGRTNQIQFQLTRSNPDGATTTTLTGSTTYSASADQISLPRFNLTDAQGRTYTALHSVLNRHGHCYRGNLSFVDGAPETPWPDYLNWILTINDPNDSDGDGVPDLSDPNAVQIPCAPLTLVTNGSGTISPALGGQNLVLGKTYRLTATPAVGYLFAGWSGDRSSSARTLSFLMVTNLNLQANFVPNPFYPVRGAYYGLIGDTNTLDNDAVGYFTATVTPGGTYSAKCRLGTQSFTVSGILDTTGNTHAVVVPPSLRPLYIQLHLDLTSNTGFSGSIGDGTWSTGITANQAVFNAASNPCAFAGKYTFAMPSSGADGDLPLGSSFGTVTVDKAGHIRCAGSLADGTRVSQATGLSGTGDWPLYLSLYGNQGRLGGWLTFTNADVFPIAGLPVWQKPAATTKFAPEGFTNQVTWMLSSYSAPAAGESPFGWTNGLISFSGGNLPEPFTNDLSVGSHNKLTTTATDKLSLRLQANGLFQGRVIPPGASRPVSFQGAFIQALGQGFGYWPNSEQSGAVEVDALAFPAGVGLGTNLPGMPQQSYVLRTNHPIEIVPIQVEPVVPMTNQFIVDTNLYIPIQAPATYIPPTTTYTPPTGTSSSGAVSGGAGMAGAQMVSPTLWRTRYPQINPQSP